MSNTVKKDQETDYQALYEELESRYGAGMAQQIVDEIKKADKKGYTLDYMVVKAVSETVELFRDEAQKALRKLRSRKKAANSDVIDIDIERTRQAFEKLFSLYITTQHSFYEMYRKAMSAHLEEIPTWKRYKRARQEPEMVTAA